ncbi:MAG: SIS domain-containing protein [Clostridiales bacterium]|jgi:D-sedoheptulose 7-phosphate isomerase|nr:SIS domain-containing protein [Clostridiales bacterium]
MNYTDESDGLIKSYPQLSALKAALEQARDALVECFKNGNKLLLAGSGGSAADCEHIAGEMIKEFKLKRKRDKEFDARFLRRFPNDGALLGLLAQGLPVVSLVSGVAINTAILNDVGGGALYAQKLYALGKKGDVFLAISTSGNSEPLIAALKVALSAGLKTIALTGAGGGKMKEYADILIDVPQTETYRVQELHLPVYHYLCAAVERGLFL